MPEHDVILLQPRHIYDRAFLGVTTRADHGAPVAIYDYQACVEAAAQWQGISLLAAVDLVLATVALPWQGPGSPMLLYRLEDFDPVAENAQSLPLAA
jgi:hypothetical protein